MTGARRVSAQAVWVAKDDGSDMIRADAIAEAGHDDNGNRRLRPAPADARPHQATPSHDFRIWIAYRALSRHMTRRMHLKAEGRRFDPASDHRL
jgi:hypothetical protein